MALSDYKITDAEIAEYGVQSQPDKLANTAAANKLVFDALVTEVVKAKLNALIDYLAGANAAGSLGVDTITGLTAENVQAALEEIVQAMADITQGAVAPGSIVTSSLDDAAVTTAKIALLAVTTALLADGAVTTAKLGDASVSTAKLADAAVTAAKIAAGAIGTTLLADGGVTTAKIANAAVDNTKLAAGAVVTVKLADEAVTGAKIAAGAVGKSHVNAALLERIGSVSLSTSWTGDSSPYTQTVTVAGVTVSSSSKVDLQPDAAVIGQMISDGCLAIYIVNNSGTLTAYAVGAAPTAALTIQCSVSETA